MTLGRPGFELPLAPTGVARALDHHHVTSARSFVAAAR